MLEDLESKKGAVVGELLAANWQHCVVHFECNVLAHVMTFSIAEVAESI